MPTPQSSRRERYGFSLIELVMVIFILAIVAGGVTLLIGRMPTTATRSTSAATVDQAFRAIQQFRSTEGRYPNRFDLLLIDHSSKVLHSRLGPMDPDDEDDGFTPIDDGELNATATDTSIIDALVAGGITQLITSPNNADATQTILTIGTDSVQVLDLLGGNGTSAPDHIVTLGANAITRLGLDATDTYLVFGLGNNCEVVGNSMLSAPLHLRQEEGAVVERYSRFLAIFRFDGTSISLTSMAGLEIVNNDVAVVGISESLRTFYESRNQVN